MCQAQSAHTNTFEHSHIAAASQLLLYALESCRCYSRSLEEYGKQEDTAYETERFASRPMVLIITFRVLMYYYLSVVRCKMLKIRPLDSADPDFYTSPYLIRKITTIQTNSEPPDIRITVEDECTNFLDEDYVSLDTKWRSAIVLHMIGIAWGILVCIGLILSMCCEWSSNFYRMSGCGWILICTLFTGLTFLALDSELCTDNPVLNEFEIQDKYEDSCEIGGGSILLIIGVTGLLFTGVMTCVISGKDVPKKEKKKKEQDKDEKDDKEDKDVEEPTSDPEPEPLVEADPEEPEPVEEPEPEPVKEPEPEPESEPEPVKEPEPEPVEEPEPVKEESRAMEETNVEDETAQEGGQDESRGVTDSETDADLFKSAVIAD
jgi:hypothetical protein